MQAKWLQGSFYMFYLLEFPYGNPFHATDWTEKDQVATRHYDHGR